MSNFALLKEVKYLGQEILVSEEFQLALTQEHHYTSTVFRHSVIVALISLSIYYFLSRFGFNINKKELVIAALAHDIGILGRTEKYSNRLVCTYKHPRESEVILRKIVPNLSESAYKAVKWHMFPVFSPLALSWTGIIITIADKVGSFKDRKK